MLIGGIGMLGRVDETSSGFVATRCFHFWFIPFVPLGSYFVTGQSWVKIPLSFKSLFAAVARPVGIYLALGCGLGLLYLLVFRFVSDFQIYTRGGTAVTLEELVELGIFMAVLAVGAVVGIALFLFTRLFRRASAARCAELTRHVGRPISPIR